MNEDKATRYHRLGRRAGFLSTLWIGVVLGALMFSGGSAGLRAWASRTTDGSAGLVVLVYVLVLFVILDVLTLPFSVYRGFFLEHRYGLATQTAGHWAIDYLKAALIGVLFAGLGATFVYFALRHWPGGWWIVAGVGYSLVIILLVNVAPVVLLPLLIHVQTAGMAKLRDRLTALASKPARAHGRVRLTLSTARRSKCGRWPHWGRRAGILLSTRCSPTIQTKKSR